MDWYTTKFSPIVKKASWDFLRNSQPELKPLSTTHIPLDADGQFHSELKTILDIEHLPYGKFDRRLKYVLG